MASDFWFYGIPVCLKVCVSVSIDITCAFFGIFTSVFHFSPILICLFGFYLIFFIFP